MVPLRVGAWQTVLPVFGEYPSRSYSWIGIAKEIQRTTYSRVLNILFGVNEILLLGNK